MSDPGGDGLAWYRHVWPWFIVLLLGAAMAASVATVWIAHAGQDSLVREDWYDDGVAINRRLEQRAEARRLGLSAELVLAPEAGTVRVALAGPGVAAVDGLRLDLSHAARAELDRTIHLAAVGDGRFEGPLESPLRGRWYASLVPADASAEEAVGARPAWRLDRSFFAGATPSIRMDGGEG